MSQMSMMSPLQKAFFAGRKEDFMKELENYWRNPATPVILNGEISPLQMACLSPDLNAVRYFLSLGEDVNASVPLGSSSGYRGETPLHIAVQHNNIEVASLLLQHGASIYIKNEGSSSPLHLAAMAPNVSMVDLLLRHDAENEDLENNSGYTHLMAASMGTNPAIVAEYFNYDGKYEDKTNIAHYRTRTNLPALAGYTPLHFAAAYGRTQTAGILIRVGADPNAEAVGGVRPIMLAKRNGHLETAGCIFEHAFKPSSSKRRSWDEMEDDPYSCAEFDNSNKRPPP